ncbi:MAG: TonB-dependent receptor [Pseudomonadota bacterium]
MRFGRHLAISGSLMVLAAGASAEAQDQDAPADELRQNTVTVTGSFIQGTPEDAALPVDVLTARDLRLEGNPTLTELIRNLGPSSGTDGESNQFGSNGLEGTANINLRGLGPGRTLVLINGRRQTVSPYAIGEQAQLFVNTNLIPGAAIGRIEVLKGGAAAIYGADAIAGVVNFITRHDLEGVELTGSFETFEGSDGNTELSASYGVQGERWNWVSTVGFRQRSETLVSEKDWAIVPFLEQPLNGWSSFGNPGSFVTLPNAQSSGITNAAVDPACSLLGGYDGGDRCRFQYAAFVDLVQGEEHVQVFSEYNRTLGDGVELHLEAMYSETDVPGVNTSPSYPPQTYTNQVLFADHPGLRAFLAANPDFSAALYGGPPTDDPLLFYGRPFALSGFPGTGFAQETPRAYEGLRFGGDLSGAFESGVTWDVGLTYSQNIGSRSIPDTFSAGFSNALAGFGVCTDPITGLDAQGLDPLSSAYSGTLVAGAGGCEYYNPFSNAIQSGAVNGVTNPGYDPAQANSPDLVDYLTGARSTEVTTDLWVFDAVISGESGFAAPGGLISYALGGQIRQESYELVPDAVSNLDVTPGASGDGPFSFLAGFSPQDEAHTIYAAFGELQIPLFDTVDVQAALRYEDYGGDIGSTVDPKIAGKWQISDAFALRVAAQTSFRGPTLNQLSGQLTTVSFVAPTGAFKAIDTFGNPDLKPESAASYDLGALFEQGGFQASLDYYHFDFEDAIIVEAQEEIVAAAAAAIATEDPSDDAIIDRITFNGADRDIAETARVRTNIVNGPSIETSGFDVRVSQDFDGFDAAALTLGLDASYVLEYVVGDFVIDGTAISGGDRVDQFNRSNFTRSLPQWKANLFANAAFGDHNLRGVVRHVDAYEDERDLASAVPIESHTTLDVFYNWAAPLAFDFGLSVVNVFDQDPPLAAFDVNYDPYTHNPFGRTFKISLSKRFGA